MGRHGPVLGSANEHFYEVVVQCVVELALKIPRELRVIEVARMDLELVGVHRDRRVLQINQDLNGFVFLTRSKGEQGMVVEPKVIEDFRKIVGMGHRLILLKNAERLSTRCIARESSPKKWGAARDDTIT